jgi:DME family drug/metabolite transporter
MHVPSGKNLSSKMQNMKTENFKKGVCYALCAAALNGSIGTLSKILLASNMPTAWIASIKTIIGFVVVSVVLALFKRFNGAERRYYLTAVAALFGIFTLFYFETAAYSSMSAANVVVTLMAVSALTANLSGWWLLGDRPSRHQWIGFALTGVGISAILGINLHVSLSGFIEATCAGVGYGLFTVLLKKFELKGGLALTRQLLFFGALFLLLPAIHQPLNLNMLTQPMAVFSLVSLAVFPTILGFVFTTKAVDCLPPAKVQLLELSEPLFSAAIAFVVLGETVVFGTVIGAVFVVFGIYLGAIKQSPETFRARKASSQL